MERVVELDPLLSGIIASRVRLELVDDYVRGEWAGVLQPNPGFHGRTESEHRDRYVRQERSPPPARRAAQPSARAVARPPAHRCTGSGGEGRSRDGRAGPAGWSGR